jgi:hypothetical protein
MQTRTASRQPERLQVKFKAESDLVIDQDLWDRLQDSKYSQFLLFTDCVLQERIKELPHHSAEGYEYWLG